MANYHILSQFLLLIFVNVLENFTVLTFVMCAYSICDPVRRSHTMCIVRFMVTYWMFTVAKSRGFYG